MLLEHDEESSVWRRRDRHIQAVLDTHSTWGHPDRPHLLQNRIDKHVLLLWTENPSPLDKRQTLQLILTNTITSSHGIQVMTANWLNFIWMYACFISQFSASIQYKNLLFLMLSGSCHVFKLNITKGVDHWQACVGSLVGLRQLKSTPEHHVIC